MSLKRCEHGHYYDPTKNSSCPACGIPDLDIDDTKPKRNTPGPLPPHTEEESTRPTRPIDDDPGRDDAPTVGVVRKKLKIDPVVGWLVCIEGPERGRDYRIRSEKNFIGRSERMDICIKGDDAISREKHASVSFNPRKNTFRIQPGESRGLVYLNDEEVDFPMELKPYDVIEIGQTKLKFAPFCGEQFEWK